MPDLRWRSPPAIGRWIADELERGRRTGDVWNSLERSHIVSQPWAWQHTRVHAAMLLAALRERNRRESIGQLIRLVVAAPGSLSGRYPAGNNGRASVPLTATASVPHDLAEVITSTLRKPT